MHEMLLEMDWQVKFLTEKIATVAVEIDDVMNIFAVDFN